MERFRKALGRFEKAYRKFAEVAEGENLESFFKREFVVEITTKRFEYTFEALWKAVKEFLYLRGIDCYSPRSCFSELVKELSLSAEEEEILYRLLKIRNELVHVYDEKRAEELYEEIKKKEILELLGKILQFFKSEA